MDRQPFTDERVDALAEQTLRELRIIGARYAKGLLTDWECEIDMTEALDRGFWVFLRDCGIRLRPDRGSYGAFAEAYRAFRSGADFGEAPQTPWLFFDAEGQTRAATAEEIRRFFRLMSRYGMTSSSSVCFSPPNAKEARSQQKPPQGIPAPGSFFRIP